MNGVVFHTSARMMTPIAWPVWLSGALLPNSAER